MRNALLLLPCLALCLRAQSEVVAVNVDSVIHPITTEILRHAIEQARRDNATALLIRLNTPGGMLEATRESVSGLLASPLPVVTLVRPGGARAASAGFFLLLAGDIAAMTEGTNTGAASPILMGQTMDAVMRKKVESDAAASLRGLAAMRGRNAAVAEMAVLEAKSFTDREALDGKLINLIVRDEADLWARLDGRTVIRSDGHKLVLATAGARVVEYQLTLRERTVSTVADPNLAFLLLVTGGLLLYIEFTTPGLILPGVSGAILLLVALMSLSVLPINSGGVALLVLAVALFALELKITSHGVLGVGGAVAMVLGAMLLVEGPPEMRIRLSTALAVSLPFAAIAVFLVSLILKARSRPVVSGAEAMLLEQGVAWTELNPAGTVLIHGEYWNARAAAPVPRGSKVRVSSMDGLLLYVEPIAAGMEKE
ncbi:MAG TPA: nodulation protein NfeD [Paludibaculum sp.]|jgi:membrane-bound serine protease (ClpP class)